MVNLLQRSGMLVVFISGIATQTAWGQVSNDKQASTQTIENTSVEPPAGPPSGQRARLIRNPKKNDGLPPFALTDQHGAIQRYVEPVEGIDLQAFVGQVVNVQHDTGRTLLASQLKLPTSPAKNTSNNTALSKAPDASAVATVPPAPIANRDTGVQPAHFISPVGYESGSLEEVQPDLAAPESIVETPPSAPVWTEEELPPGGEPVYIDGPHGSSFGGHYGKGGYGNGDCVNGDCGNGDCGNGDFGNYGCCSHCDGGNHCSHCPRRGRSSDRGLFAGIFDDSCRPEGCAPGARGRYYLRGEYLYWTFDGMYIPELVVGGTVESQTVNGITTESFGVREILYGRSEILDGYRDGTRITFGWFRDPCGLWAIEGDYLSFGTESESFDSTPFGVNPIAAVDGTPGAIGRPFFRVPQRIVNGELESLNAVEDVVFTGIGGNVTVDTRSDFESFGLRFRHNLCCSSPCDTGCGDCCDSVGCGSSCGSSCGRGGRGTRRIDFSLGGRYARLDEGITIFEDLEEPNNDGFLVTDSFDTDNQFYGAEIGFNWEWEYCRWKLDLLSRLAVGNTHQQVAVNGSTTFINNGVIGDTAAGGLLAQPDRGVDFVNGVATNTELGNIGVRETDKLSVLPELGVNVGYQLTANLHFTLGYTFLYWSNVVRPGDQIDLDVNPDTPPRENGPNTTPPTNSANPPRQGRPRPFFNATDFFAHGLNVGLEFRR